MSTLLQKHKNNFKLHNFLYEICVFYAYMYIFWWLQLIVDIQVFCWSVIIICSFLIFVKENKNIQIY